MWCGHVWTCSLAEGETSAFHLALTASEVEALSWSARLARGGGRHRCERSRPGRRPPCPPAGGWRPSTASGSNECRVRQRSPRPFLTADRSRPVRNSFRACTSVERMPNARGGRGVDRTEIGHSWWGQAPGRSRPARRWVGGGRQVVRGTARGERWPNREGQTAAGGGFVGQVVAAVGRRCLKASRAT